MSQYTIGQMRDLNTYGDHLFYLDNKLISFFTEQAEEVKKGLQTKVSNSYSSNNSHNCSLSQLTTTNVDHHFQMGFMNEHELILQKYIKKNRELLGNNQESQQSNMTQFSAQSNQQSTLERTFKTIEESSSYFDQEQFHRITHEMLKHHQLANFLRTILSKYSPRLSLTLIKITCRIWIEYSQRNRQKLIEREIVEQTNRILTHRFLKEVNQLLPQPLQLPLLSKLKMFMNVLTNTVLFIANQYFMNPYYQLEQQLILQEFTNYQLFLYDSHVLTEGDEEEEEMGLQGRKLIKRDTSF